jgi:sugar fermentation stimulation protein A
MMKKEMERSVRITGETITGVFQGRPNRFSAFVRAKGEILLVYLPNPGRMRELLTLGTKVTLRKAEKENRKTRFDLIGVIHNGHRVSLDSRLPNRLILSALRNRNLGEFVGYDTIIPEYIYDHTRFDFFLTDGNERCLLEVKSTTLIEEEVAMFPDAVTARGRRHVNNLTKAKGEGYRACVLFVVQRDDARAFAPCDKVDPKFGEALRNAAANGVEVYAYKTNISEDFSMITISSKLAVNL